MDFEAIFTAIMDFFNAVMGGELAMADALAMLSKVFNLIGGTYEEPEVIE